MTPRDRFMMATRTIFVVAAIIAILILSFACSPDTRRFTPPWADVEKSALWR